HQTPPPRWGRKTCPTCWPLPPPTPPPSSPPAPRSQYHPSKASPPQYAPHSRARWSNLPRRRKEELKQGQLLGAWRPPWTSQYTKKEARYCSFPICSIDQMAIISFPPCGGRLGWGVSLAGNRPQLLPSPAKQGGIG